MLISKKDVLLVLKKVRDHNIAIIIIIYLPYPKHCTDLLIKIPLIVK